MEGRLGKFVENTANRLAHLNSQEKNNLSDNLLIAAAFIFLCSISGMGSIGGYVALGTAALSAVKGTAVRFR
jgi:hypothetical protein